MKTNTNMSVGIFKNTLIYILLEDDNQKRSEMMDKFCAAIENMLFQLNQEERIKELTTRKIDII